MRECRVSYKPSAPADRSSVTVAIARRTFMGTNSCSDLYESAQEGVDAVAHTLTRVRLVAPERCVSCGFLSDLQCCAYQQIPHRANILFSKKVHNVGSAEAGLRASGTHGTPHRDFPGPPSDRAVFFGVGRGSVAAAIALCERRAQALEMALLSLDEHMQVGCELNCTLLTGMLGRVWLSPRCTATPAAQKSCLK